MSLIERVGVKKIPRKRKTSEEDEEAGNDKETDNAVMSSDDASAIQEEDPEKEDGETSTVDVPLIADGPPKKKPKVHKGKKQREVSCIDTITILFV
jgi:hypothetical protein